MPTVVNCTSPSGPPEPPTTGAATKTMATPAHPAALEAKYAEKSPAKVYKSHINGPRANTDGVMKPGGTFAPVAHSPICPAARNARNAPKKLMAPVLQVTGSGSKSCGEYQRASRRGDRERPRPSRSSYSGSFLRNLLRRR